MWKAPFLKRPSRGVFCRVPSGAMISERPCFSASTAGFSASIAFEQSYGGIDGDSASGAEFCCLISALTGVPIRQGLAMTGAIDQHGHVQAIGGVNEKVDGFFDACASRGLTGHQGCIIPKSNAGDLMLRQDVVDAVAEGQFHIYAVAHVDEGIELLTGLPAGEPDAEGRYPEGTVGHAVETRLAELAERRRASARRSSGRPARSTRSSSKCASRATT